jgi:hypothetical protein
MGRNRILDGKWQMADFKWPGKTFAICHLPFAI